SILKEYGENFKMEKKSKSVFLTDAQQRKSLAVIRSLGLKGIDVITGEDTRWATSRFSKYCSKGLVYPKPINDRQKYLSWLKELLQKNNFKVLFPMDDVVMDIVVNNQGELKDYCSLLLPELNDYIIASDKNSAVGKAKSVGIDIPISIKVNGGDSLEKLDLLTNDLIYPVIIKPRKSSGSRGIAIVEGPRGMVTEYLRIHKEYPFPLIQEYIPQGPRYDVCLLYDNNGKLRASFVQKELRHFPLERGPSTLQESVWRPDLVEKADRLMKGLNWKGIAEVEFMEDPRDGTYKFMEINTRFWASLNLSIVCGVDFPWLYYCLAINKEINDVFEYKIGIRCRWSLPGDILHFVFNKERWSLEPSFFAGKKHNVYDDILSWDDPMPIIGFILAVLHYMPDKKMWKMIFKR
ncbi:MAG: ATP-grasp domain-containing protein, partial [Eubacteriales bacterium]